MPDETKVSTWASLLPEVGFDLYARLLPGLAFLVVLDIGFIDGPGLPIAYGAGSPAVRFLLFVLLGLGAGLFLGVIGHFCFRVALSWSIRAVNLRRPEDLRATGLNVSELEGLPKEFDELYGWYRRTHDAAKERERGLASLLPKLGGECGFFWNSAPVVLIAFGGWFAPEKTLTPAMGAFVVLFLLTILGGLRATTSLIDRQIPRTCDHESLPGLKTMGIEHQ